jgi:hypothetical protein
MLSEGLFYVATFSLIEAKQNKFFLLTEGGETSSRSNQRH